MITNIKKGKITHKVTRNDDTYDLEPLIILKFNIATGKTFDNETWNKIITENKYYYYDRLGLLYLKQLKTNKELFDHLLSKGSSIGIINQLIKKYETFGYLDDLNYTKLYIDQRKQKEGPKVITNKLSKKGINIDTIHDCLKLIDERKIVNNIVSNLISKNKTKTKLQLTNTIKRSLLTKGYTYEVINDAISKNISKFNVDELALLEKEYANLVMRRISNVDDATFKQKATNRLYRRGYSISDIKKVENKHFKDNN